MSKNKPLNYHFSCGFRRKNGNSTVCFLTFIYFIDSKLIATIPMKAPSTSTLEPPASTTASPFKVPAPKEPGAKSLVAPKSLKPPAKPPETKHVETPKKIVEEVPPAVTRPRSNSVETPPKPSLLSPNKDEGKSHDHDKDDIAKPKLAAPKPGVAKAGTTASPQKPQVMNDQQFY